MNGDTGQDHFQFSKGFNIPGAQLALDSTTSTPSSLHRALRAAWIRSRKNASPSGVRYTCLTAVSLPLVHHAGQVAYTFGRTCLAFDRLLLLRNHFCGA
jgi:hypothetical protein